MSINLIEQFPATQKVIRASGPIGRTQTTLTNNQTQPNQTNTTPQTQPSTAQTGTSVSDELNRIRGEAMDIQGILDQRRAGEPTVGESLAGVGDGLNQFPSFNEIYGEPANEQDVMRNQMRLFQSEIDATNQIYDQMLNQARLEGTGRLGSQRAMSARGGLLGSDFAGAQKATVQDFNTGIERGIQAERSAAIGAIMGNVRSSVQQQLAEKRQARQQGAENYLNWLANSEQRRNQNTALIAQDLMNQGIDPTTLSEEELVAITSEAGVNRGDVMRQFTAMQQQQQAEMAQLEQQARETQLKEAKTQAEIAKIEADIARGTMVTLGEGSMLYNTETGEFFKNPRTTASGGAGSTTIPNVPDDLTQNARLILEESRGSDTFTDTGTYLEIYNDFVSAGVKPEEFVKAFDPDKYINPNDPSRGWLESQMRRPQQQDPIAQLFTDRLQAAGIGLEGIGQ